MGNLSQLELVLKVMFRQYPPQRVFEHLYDFDGIDEDNYIHLAYPLTSIAGHDRFSKEDLRNQFRYYLKHINQEFYNPSYKNNISELLKPVNCLFFYTKQVLVIKDNEVVCRYQKLMDLQRMTNEINVDLLVSAFWAMQRMPNDMSEKDFSWKLVIGHDNYQLKRIMERGLAENHFHLYGSAPVFHLSWLSLMNTLTGSNAVVRLANYDKKRMALDKRSDTTIPEIPLHTQHIQAAAIRLILFVLLKAEKPESIFEKIVGVRIEKIISALQEPFKNKDMRCYELDNLIYNLQNAIDSFRDFHGESLPDYALSGKPNLYDEDNEVFQGERWLLYNCLFLIYHNKLRTEYKNLFYTYLIIKENIRHELIQLDKKVGFSHFQDYNKRKFDLLDESIFHGKQGIAARSATTSNLLNPCLKSLEIRVSPCMTADDNLDMIRKLDYIIGEPRARYFYTLHFLKRNDPWSNYDPNAFYCRHYKIRNLLHQQTYAIKELRERYPNRARRILGIDAASQEIGCRPEVFGVYFRYLHAHTKAIEGIEFQTLPQLRRTYHVGEDFLDVTDGLRAIDEAIKFLGLESGDRLGHALALGINVRDWYIAKNNVITLSKQDYLDNVVWLYHKLLKYRITGTEDLQEVLKKEFSVVFSSIYIKNMPDDYISDILAKYREDRTIYDENKWVEKTQFDFDIYQYYRAWKLRSDDPNLYELGYFHLPELDTLFDRCRVNKDVPRDFNTRYVPEVFLINYFYHYSKSVRIEGEKQIQKEVTQAYIEGVAKVQQAFQREIGQMGLAIETNPTSNILIGTFKQYDQHPILNFYNRELEVDTNILANNPQLLVSINTDDQGIFNTSLENEYALLACALENVKDSNGNYRYPRQRVYAWLDSIRKMGLDQSFGKIISQKSKHNKMKNRLISLRCKK